jgi:hypothetical protein
MIESSIPGIMRLYCSLIDVHLLLPASHAEFCTCKSPSSLNVYYTVRLVIYLLAHNCRLPRFTGFCIVKWKEVAQRTMSIRAYINCLFFFRANNIIVDFGSCILHLLEKRREAYPFFKVLTGCYLPFPFVLSWVHLSSALILSIFY